MNLMDVASSDPGKIIPKSSEFNRKRTKTTLPDIFRNLQHDFGGIDPSDSNPSRHLSGSGSSSSSDSEDSTDFSPIKIAEDNLGLSPLRLLPGFAASIRKRKQFLMSMSPPRELFSQFPTLAPLGNAETEEHEENAQDENEDDGPFASEALSDSEEDKSPEHVLVTGRRFKETLREEKPPRIQVDTVARQPSAEAFILLEWLDSFFLSHCERQPADGKYHLPNNFTKKDVYVHYMTDMVQVRECLQYSSFKHYWVKFYPLVTIPTTNKFSVCDFCELYKSKRDKGVTNIEKAEAVQALKLHRKQQAEERAAAGRRRWKALDSPKDCAYIQIDGMDQKKTILPHFSKQPKSVDGAALVGVHLVGAMIFHGKLHTQRDEHAVDEPVAVTTTEEFKRRIFGQRRPIYSGPRRPAPGSAAADRAVHIWELTEIQEKSFLAVLADDETSFWICQVLKINRRNEEGEPTSVHIQWYATEDSNPYTGKFYPEKRRTNGKGRAALFRQEIDLEEVTVLSFNFIFTTARRLRKVT
ncbi:hypothetical protein R1sor_015267 [Riccia sorocarpa]|uniref:BAH domain-containing protein n=1 Tax=Riccia sorocarpa TaxID=122646 RepID=A0ABD3HC85_9MARC